MLSRRPQPSLAAEGNPSARSENMGVKAPSVGAVTTGVDVKRKVVADNVVTGHGRITVRQSIIPVSLVTILFFMWVRRNSSLVS